MALRISGHILKSTRIFRLRQIACERQNSVEKANVSSNFLTERLCVSVLPSWCESQQIRSYAKGRNKEKKDAKKKSAMHYGSLPFSPTVLDAAQVSEDIKVELDWLKETFVTQLSLRVDLRAYEQLSVTMDDGTTRTLQQLVIRKKPTFLEVSLSLPEYQKPVKQAIERSALNVTPQSQQATLILPLPRVTREHREQLVKKTDSLLHQCTDKLNAVYKKYEKGIQDLMTAGNVPKDEVVAASKALLEMKNGGVTQAKELTKHKKKQLMEETL